MGRRASLHNLGCKVNAYETEAMEQLLKEAGYTVVAFGEPADVCIINTCSVTNVAGRIWWGSWQTISGSKSVRSRAVGAKAARRACISSISERPGSMRSSMWTKRPSTPACR